jgi:hypothetical protein
MVVTDIPVPMWSAKQRAIADGRRSKDMRMVKRYGRLAILGEAQDGDYVQFRDYAALLVERDILYARIRKLKSAVSALCPQYAIPAIVLDALDDEVT